MPTPCTVSNLLTDPRPPASCPTTAVAYSSGSAATSAIIHLLNSGDHVISIDDVYGGTQRYFR